jgi:hypothetical protein
LNKEMNKMMETIYSLLAVLFLTTMMARNFSPSEDGGNPIHWFRLKVGEALDVDLHSVMFGTLGDFAEELNLMVPQERKDWEQTIAALVVAKEAVVSNDDSGHPWVSSLFMQNAAVNDLMTVCMEHAKYHPKTGPAWADSYGGVSVHIEHNQTEHGNRSRYSVTVVEAAK